MWSLLTLSILQMTSQTSSAGTLYPIAVSGQAVPDGNGVFGGQGVNVLGFTGPTLNNQGVVCFHANVTGSTGAHSAAGIFCGTPGITTQVARGGQFPGILAGGQFETTQRNSGAINDAGQVAFKTEVTPVMNDRTYAVFRKGGGRDSFALFARGADPAPGEGSYGDLIDSRFRPALSPVGHVAFFANLTGTSGGAADDTGIFRSNAAGDSVVRIVQEGDPVPGSSGTLTPDETMPAINASGEVAFKADVLGVSGGIKSAIVRGDGQTRTLIANVGTAIPGAGTIRDFGVGTDVSMNSSGNVAFWAELQLSGSSFPKAVLLGDSASNLAVVAKGGDRLANFPGDLLSVNRHVALNDAGQVAYLGSITADSGGAPWALFRGTTVVAYDGLALSGFGVSIVGMNNREFVINSSGKIAFTALISIPGSANGYGIYVWDGAGNYEEVTRYGASFLGSTISGLEFAGTSSSNVLQPGMNGFNDLGEVTFRYELADGREGIALWSSLPKPASVVGGQIQSVAGGFQVRFPGVPGWDYVIERDEDLVPPWTRLSPAFRANDAGWITLDDLGPGLPQKRFYRCAEAP